MQNCQEELMQTKAVNVDQTYSIEALKQAANIAKEQQCAAEEIVQSLKEEVGSLQKIHARYKISCDRLQDRTASLEATAAKDAEERKHILERLDSYNSSLIRFSQMKTIILTKVNGQLRALDILRGERDGLREANDTMKGRIALLTESVESKESFIYDIQGRLDTLTKTVEEVSGAECHMHV